MNIRLVIPMSKARKGYTDKLGRRWEWDAVNKKYVYQRKGTKSTSTDNINRAADRVKADKPHIYSYDEHSLAIRLGLPERFLEFKKVGTVLKQANLRAKKVGPSSWKVEISTEVTTFTEKSEEMKGIDAKPRIPLSSRKPAPINKEAAAKLRATKKQVTQAQVNAAYNKYMTEYSRVAARKGTRAGLPNKIAEYESKYKDLKAELEAQKDRKSLLGTSTSIVDIAKEFRSAVLAAAGSFVSDFKYDEEGKQIYALYKYQGRNFDSDTKAVFSVIDSFKEKYPGLKFSLGENVSGKGIVRL